MENYLSNALAAISDGGIPLLNNWFVGRAEHYGFVKRWRGFCLIAADASTVRFGLLASHVKLRLNIKHVSGLTEQAVVQDVAVELLTDNMQALAALTAQDQADLDVVNRINHAHAHTVLKPLRPSLLMYGKKVKKLLNEAVRIIGKQTYRHRDVLSKPRPARPKPHKYMPLKNC